MAADRPDQRGSAFRRRILPNEPEKDRQHVRDARSASDGKHVHVGCEVGSEILAVRPLHHDRRRGNGALGSEVGDLPRLALFGAEDVRMGYRAVFLDRQGEGREGVRLPDADGREAQIKMLAWVPGVLGVLVVQTDDIAVLRVGKDGDVRVGGLKAHGAAGQVLIVDQGRAKDSDASVDEPYDKARNHSKMSVRTSEQVIKGMNLRKHFRGSQ